MGFVYRKDGKWFSFYERITHTGTRRSFSWEYDLQKASVIYNYPPEWMRSELDGAMKFAVTEIRTVSLS